MYLLSILSNSLVVVENTICYYCWHSVCSFLFPSYCLIGKFMNISNVKLLIPNCSLQDIK